MANGGQVSVQKAHFFWILIFHLSLSVMLYGKLFPVLFVLITQLNRNNKSAELYANVIYK